MSFQRDSQKNKKKRADEWVYERGLAESRSKAQAYILAGYVLVRREGFEETWNTVEKAGHLYSEKVLFKLKEGSLNTDVSRGAQKLRAAFKNWTIDVKNKIALDIGSSTGGFTQVLLEEGAKKVLALDVGTHQLHERLRADPRVLSVEQQHVLRIEPVFWDKQEIRPPFDVIVTDVSFISVRKIIHQVLPWLGAGASWIVLLKPQFELEPKKVPKGIVRDIVHRQEAIDSFQKDIESFSGFEWKAIIESPILGGDGNMEYLVWIKNSISL